MRGLSLGRFGDRRLEKGGSFYCRGSWKAAVGVYGFAVSEEREREKSV